jgi:hypothetical protein
MNHRRFSEDEGFARAWAAFARHDRAQAAPARLDARVRRSLAARRGAAVPELVFRRPAANARVVAAVAACLVAAVTAGWLSGGSRRASTDPGLPEAPAIVRTVAAVAMPVPAALDVPALRGVAVTTPVPRPAPASRPPLATATADGPLQVIRVRIAASALDALGVAVAGPIASGLVDVDLVVSADGWPMEVRRIRPVPADGPLQ